MLTKRIIPAIDVLQDKAVKYVKFRNPTVIGDPAQLGKLYAEAGADEIIYLDTSASLHNEEVKYDWIRRVAEDVFIPFSVIGGIKTVDDIRRVLRSGADKVGINSAAVKRPELISEAAQVFGSQCVVLGLDVMPIYNEENEVTKWEVYTHSAHENTGMDAVEWVKYAESLGAGEVICTSIEKDGTKEGYDLELIKTLSRSVKIPIIASGGAGKLEHIRDVFNDGDADAALVASLLHYKEYTVQDIKKYLLEEGLAIRI
ncbi:imidazole glycerol phosphate synthase subunit HisF [Paenibacillus algicola]|uniref:Imidazole glycerol phosphate synthase subunit HisF n=1 Tax=Paenibacillus algicola TaxID=2565926 RepID=A0A4P8XJ81_9BACL|nr:imidazole glycerol phosphate synthase subunit HisF [Paenibacillus algicola]QCT01401.1 imidazole glycerol phosphate synthase subunit HisF [Paenibacillus algicola]